MKTFKELGLDLNLLTAVEELGFVTPTPIQSKVIPILLSKEKEDIVALAQTGTGKTAAFGLPLIQNTDFELKGVQKLILSPTRELCLQIAEDLQDYSKYYPALKIAAVFGGSSIEKQIRDLKSGAQIISATPGRLIDLINRGAVKLSKVDAVILDEADEMLNMGFRDELEKILAETPKEKQTLLFSATMPSEVRKIAGKYMSNPVEISAGKKNAGADDVEHFCYTVHAKDRYLALKRIVDYFPDIYGIVFCRTRRETQEVAESLIKDGYSAEPIHGDLSQSQRDAVMNKFRNKNLNLLVATDVAARGIDVENLSHIINYNLPDEIDVYTHRSGRTGRAGKAGISIIISNLKEKNKIQSIEKKIGKRFAHLEVPGGKQICERQMASLIERIEKTDVDEKQIASFLPFVMNKFENMEKEELIKKVVSLEFNRLLDYYKNSPDLSQVKGDKKKKSSYRLSRFFINLGKKDDIKPASLIGLICDKTRVKNIEIGEIEILKKFSFFEADENFSDKILSSLNGKEFKGRTINVEVAEGEKREKNFKEKKSRTKSFKTENNSRRDFKSSGKKKSGKTFRRS